jgi:hypothetical protein
MSTTKLSVKAINQGVQLLYNEILRSCDATNVPIVGPHNFLTVIPKLAEFFNVQINLIESKDNF